MKCNARVIKFRSKTAKDTLSASWTNKNEGILGRGFGDSRAQGMRLNIPEKEASYSLKLVFYDEDLAHTTQELIGEYSISNVLDLNVGRLKDGLAEKHHLKKLCVNISELQNVTNRNDGIDVEAGKDYYVHASRIRVASSNDGQKWDPDNSGPDLFYKITREGKNTHSPEIRFCNASRCRGGMGQMELSRYIS